MKTIISIFALFLCINANAQKIFWYAAEGKDYYEVSECKPGSNAAFYSSVHGGKQLGVFTVSENGTVIIPGNKEFHPQMVLNNGEGGTNHVAFLGVREFAINTPAVTGKGMQAIVNWHAAVTDHKDLSFELYKSTDGKSFKLLNTFSSQSGEAMMPYAFTEKWNGAAALYKIAVVS